jgi:5-formyltetrahydrofolate cyclo-ligase
MQQGESKAALRSAAIARRDAISPEARERFAERIALTGVDLARRTLSRTVAAYWPLPGEADTRGLVHALSYHEFVTALPVVVGHGMPLIFRKWAPRDMLVPGPFGVMEPSARLPEVHPDVVFVPLAAFDRRGHRIGFGAGFYDRTLQALRAMKPVLCIGIAFGAQEVPDIPADPHDQPVDFVLTEAELIDCRSNQQAN